MINQLSLRNITNPIFALSDVQSQELLKFALSNPLYSIVTVVLLIIGLLIGWKIYPYTIGGFDAFATSALGHLQARMATATFGGLVGAGLGIYLLVVKIDKESTPSEKLAAIESEQTELRNDVRNSDNPASATSEQKTRMRELEARKEELRLKKAEVDRLAASNPPTPRTKTNSHEPAAPPVNKVGSTETSDNSDVDGPSIDSPSDSQVPKNSNATRIAELKGELASVNSKIESERSRWTDARDTINQLTNFKKTPVREGSPAYHRCMAASKVINEVESGAPSLKAEKARLETIIKALEG